MSLLRLVHHQFCEQCSRKDSFKRFSVSNDTQYGPAGVDICVSDTGDEGLEGAVDKAVRDSAEVLVSDDHTAGVRKVLCVGLVTYQYLEGSCVIRAYRLLLALILLMMMMPKTRSDLTTSRARMKFLGG